jgi:hypothetical protein
MKAISQYSPTPQKRSWQGRQIHLLEIEGLIFKINISLLNLHAKKKDKEGSTYTKKHQMQDKGREGRDGLDEELM